MLTLIESLGPRLTVEHTRLDNEGRVAGVVSVAFTPAVALGLWVGDVDRALAALSAGRFVDSHDGALRLTSTRHLGHVSLSVEHFESGVIGALVESSWRWHRDLRAARTLIREERSRQRSQHP